jgi:hypothetical protein
VVQPPDRRLAKNEALFREVNETVQALETSNGNDSDLHEFFCECADLECTIRVKLTHSEYETARVEATRFIVMRGHERLDIERIVLESDRYLLVEKTGGGADEARKLDPTK